MEQRNSLLLVVVVAIGAIAVGLQAADEKNANYTTHILALPDQGQGTVDTSNGSVRYDAT